MRYLQQSFDINETPQTASQPHRQADSWARLGRFLITGSEVGTYRVAEREPSLAHVAAVRDCLQADGLRVVRTVVEVSMSGRAPKNDPALFALAMAASPSFADPKTNAVALQVLPEVARTGMHLCTFAAFAGNFRGWGRGLRSAIAEWYLSKPVSEVAYQFMTHQNSSGWSHRDLLRLSHPKAATTAHKALFQWAADGKLGHLATHEIRTGELRQVQAFELAKKAASEGEVVYLIEDYRLTHELIPSEWKHSARVWEALLDSMPYMELVRHLGELTAVGLLGQQNPATALAVARLSDRRRVANAKVHPVALLAELLAYQQGRDQTGSLEWLPVTNVMDALDQAFYLAFDNIEPSGQRIYLALDASESMQRSRCLGIPHLPASLASAVIAMAFAKTEAKLTIAAFHDSIWHVDLTRQDRLDHACAAIAYEARGVDASLPMMDALDRQLAVDAFVIVTDNEAWARDQHPTQALDRYRRETGIAAKLVVIATAASECKIADSNDAGQINVAGFDASVPGIVSDFIRGRL
jgi:60 kDa SS-A/Ro ribonucleoprotein